MTVEQILEQLLEIQKFNREQIDRLYRMDKEEGRKMYGSITTFNDAKKIWLGKCMQIEDLIIWIEYRINK